MKIAFHSVLAGALLMAGGVAIPATTPVACAAEPDTTIPKVVLPKPNGYDLILEAANSYVPGIEGAPATKLRMAPNENMMAQRQSVSRNAKSLKLVHEGLLLPVMTPPPSNATQTINYDAFRSLARLLKQEASVKTTSADWLGSINSQLDAVELGVVMTRGAGLQAAEVGLSLESLGHLGLTSVLPRLSPPELQQVAVRLQKIEALRPPISEIIRGEKSRALVYTQFSMEERDWERVLKGLPDEEPVDPNAPPGGEMQGDMGGEGRPDMAAPVAPPAPQGPFNEREINQLRNMGVNELQTNIARYFDSLINNAKVPYGTTLPRIAPAADPWSRFLTQEISQESIRLAYETARTQNLLLIHSLGLGAARTITGKYPATLETASDPFRPSARFIYKPNGESYLLYSVGPDGKDDGGTPAKTIPFVRDDEPVAVSNGLELKTTGDILAPIL